MIEQQPLKLQPTSDLGEDDEDSIGPLPPNADERQSSASFAADLMDDDSDFSDNEEIVDDKSSDWKIPCSFDLLFEHGDKAVSLKKITKLFKLYANAKQCTQKLVKFFELLFNFDYVVDFLMIKNQ